MSTEINPNEPEITLTPEEQAIADKASGVDISTDDGIPVELPSDTPKEGDKPTDKLADKYDTVEDLRKGIESIGSDLPEYVLKGMSDEALEQHYLELQKDFHGDKPDSRKHAADKPDEKANEDKPEAVTDELWTELNEYYGENGNITGDMYDKLNKVGIPDAVIDKYMDALQGDAVAFTNDIYAIAGGEDNYNTIKSWADNNIPAEQLDAIGKMDKQGMLLAMEGIKAKYAAANPDAPTRILGDTKVTTAGAYTDQASYILDIGDKRYGLDKKYTHAVDTKFKNSKSLQ